jgi:hypothetical protein
MRRVSCDQYEFDSHESEQSLEIALSTPSPHCPVLATLLAKCGASALEGQSLPVNWRRWGLVAEHLERFAGVSLPHASQVRTSVMLRDDWDDVELGLSFDSVFAWYHWQTSA